MNITEILRKLLTPPNDRAKATGHVRIDMRDAMGNLKQVLEIPNLVVTTGLQYIADQLSDQGEAAMSHMAIGSDNTAATAGDTTLGTELGRVALTSTTQSGADVVYIATFPAGTGTGNVYEAGIFNDASAGTMLCRTVFGLVTKAAGDSITITWTLTISAA